MLQNIGIIEQGGIPQILQASGSVSSSPANTRNLSVALPAATKLLIALLSFRMQNQGSTFSTPTFNGVAMTAGSPLETIQQRPSSAIYYMLNPPIGTFNLNMAITGGNDWSSSYMRAICLDRGTIGPDSSIASASSGSSLSLALTLARKALVLGLFSQIYDAGTNPPTYSLTNLTLEHQAQDTGPSHGYATAYNNDDPPGAQTYGFDSNWTSSAHYRTANALAIYG